ncbi:MAG TPA: cell division ATP-binding protein FtsE [Candidatus Pacearchaeota archaeon]|nr:cell division ATP-binding protein FtsE [Candidatus Pacearchaeota archaeon]
MIKFDQVSKLYSNSCLALDNINLEIKQGEFVTIVGKSGAGKTTLIKLLIREELPTEGQVYFDGQSVLEMNRRQICQLRQRIGVVYQDYKLLPQQTVYGNVAYVLSVIGASDSEIERDVPRVLEIVGLADKTDDFPHQLSGGEKQRLAIARALIHQPEVIMADEPSGNLDPYNTWDIIEVLNKIHQMGTTVVVATHDKDVIAQTEGRVIALNQGRIIRDDYQTRNFVF